MDDTRTAPRADRPDPGAERGLVIAVDGPSGSGKSTVSRAVADRLGLRYLDTGAMYRAVTRRVLDAGADLTQPAEVGAVAARVQLEPGTDPRHPTITADGRDLTAAVRAADVTEAVSTVSAVPEVRRLMVERQREVIGGGDIVVEGRDIGTTVVPDADVKVFLVADADARAQRRSLELTSSLGAADTTEVHASLLRRDAADAGRAASPLTRAPDAVQIDTTAMDVAEVVDTVLGLVPAPGEPRSPDAAEGPHGPARVHRPPLVRAKGRPRRWLMRVARRFGWWLFHRVFRLRVLGLENVPAEGPVLLAGNHTGFLDGPAVFAVTPRPAQFFIKSELYDARALVPMLDALGQIPINRKRPDRPALRSGLAALAAGQVVGMFPEGSRGSGDLETVQHGIAYLALKAGCPVVPVACFGTLDALPEGRRLPVWRTPVDVVFGAPFVVDPPGDTSARSATAAAAEIIRQHLRAHLAEAAARTGRPPSAARRPAADEPPDPAR